MTSLKSFLPPALRHRRFLLYWTGLLISISGSQMQMTGLLWHLRTLSDQPILVSGIGLMRFFPILFLAPFGGVLADSVNRRQIIFVTQTVLALVAATLGMLTWLGVIRIWHVYLLAVLQACALSFDLPARQSLVPNLVSREDYPSAFSLQSIASSTAAIVGPALSGLVIGYMGQAYVYWINAISFGALLLAVFLMGPIEQNVHALGGGLNASLSSIKEGVTFILRQPIILSSMLLDFAATFFSSANTLLPFVARDILHVNEVAYGWLVSAESMGAVLVGFFMARTSRLRRQGKLLLGAVFLYGIATVLLGVSRTYALALVAMFLIGTGDTISTILRNTIRQLQTPDYIRGRMSSINQVFFQGGPQLGEIEAGAVAQAFGIPFAIISGGIGCILAVALVALRYPQLRRYYGDESLAAG